MKVVSHKLYFTFYQFIFIESVKVKKETVGITFNFRKWPAQILTKVRKLWARFTPFPRVRQPYPRRGGEHGLVSRTAAGNRTYENFPRKISVEQFHNEVLCIFELMTPSLKRLVSTESNVLIEQSVTHGLNLGRNSHKFKLFP